MLNESEPAFFPTLRAAMVSEPWCLDVVSLQDSAIRVAGWAVPIGGDPARGNIVFNGQPAQDASFGLPRPDIAGIYGFVPGAALAGFSATGTFDPAADHIRIDYAEASATEPLCANHSFYVPLRPQVLPIPGPAFRDRTTGATDDTTFLFGGYTLFRKFDRILREHAGRGIGDFEAVLDWGAGCGRLSRHILPELGEGASLTMADIDEANMAWCAANMPGATVTVLPLSPPSALPSDRFDLVIGNSVFTHLQEAVQFAWLAELRRVARPGAYILVTVHNVKDMLRATTSEALYARLFSHGFVDDFPDPALAGNIADPGYYRASFHTHDYIRRTWSPILRVEAIIPDCSNNHQDLVILRKD